MVRLHMTSKTATIEYKPVTCLASNNNTLAYYKQSRGYVEISHALSNIHGLYGAAVISLTSYSLNPGKLPGSFSYKRPGYEATCTGCFSPSNMYLSMLLFM